MSEASFQAPVGTHDVLGPESQLWEGIVATFAQLAYRYGFSMVISPLFEDVGVFHRGIGEASEVARKEMYVFEDRGGRRLALRPEGTASLVRAFIQHHPVTPWRAWYLTPAFRYERPQAGRYRQHHQLGVEVLGSDDPAIDVEVIALAERFFRAVGITKFRLLINSMGHDVCRGAYVEVLRGYLGEHQDELCDDHQKIWSVNPLRVLDCKKPSCAAVTTNGPQLPDYLCDDCRTHLASVVQGLEAIGIASVLSPRLVRGFDYYTRTTFEFVSDVLDAAQNALGGGGRYDKLAEELGGDPTSGIGFGVGVERLLLVRAAEGATMPLLKRSIDLFVIDTTTQDAATTLVDELRSAGYAVLRAYDQRSMKSQMKLADRSGARLALLIGPQEFASNEVTMRDLRSQDFEQAQTRVPRSAIVSAVAQQLS
ncbi:MAG TPA: histidine--tRNA ligase, partial [Acidimicrobiales bacterium]|nr:histidine--tRNA ligase [Acidimicrobiales bacterium]